MNAERLQVLLDRYFDQLLTALECNELQKALARSADARGRFWEVAHFHSLLRHWGTERSAKGES